MYRFFVAIGLVVACVIGLGFYFGYLQIGTDSTDSTTRITLTVGLRKIQADEKKAVEKVNDFVPPSKD